MGLEKGLRKEWRQRRGDREGQRGRGRRKRNRRGKEEEEEEEGVVWQTVLLKQGRLTIPGGCLGNFWAESRRNAYRAEFSVTPKFSTWSLFFFFPPPNFGPYLKCTFPRHL